MQAALRPYVTAGIALVGASLIAATPVTPSLPGLAVEQPAIRLLASSIANIPVNLAISLANIPYYESLALQEYAYALGPANTTGGVPGWIPPGTPNSDIDPGPDKEYGTADDLYKRGGTGSWWTESTDGNTWGWDNGNWPQLAAIGTSIFPFELALPIAQQLQTFAQAEFIAGERVNCEFECADVLGYLGGWLMFQTPLTALLSGTNFPNTINAIDPVTGEPIKPVWAGQPGAQLDPLGLAQVFADYLMQDPSDNPIMFPDLGGVLSNSVQLGVDYANDYNPLATGSFLYWGAPTLWSAPALLAGLVQNFTGIPNQFVGIGAWTGAGGIPPGGSTAGPATLLTGVPAGFAYLAQGLLGYLNPGTYLGPNGISLGNTLLRTYAWGSLPGSDIVSQLTGLGAGTLLDGAGIGALGSGGLLGGLVDNLPGLGGLPGSSSNSATLTSASNVDPSNEKKQEQVGPLNVANQPDASIDPGATAAEAPGNVSPPLQGPVQESVKKALDNVTNAGPTLDVQTLNPLDRADAKDDGAVTPNTNNDTTGNHGLGAGKTPVRDLINKVTGGEVTGGGNNEKGADASKGSNE